MQRIRHILATGPKTWDELRKELKEPRTSVYFALRDLIRWKIVYGFIDDGTLGKTKNRFTPVFNLTGINPIIQGGGFSDKSAVYSVLELDDKGNEIGRQRYKKVKSRLGSRYEYVDRKVGKFKYAQKGLHDEDLEYIKAFGHREQPVRSIDFPTLEMSIGKPPTDFRKQYFKKKILEQYEKARKSQSF